MIRTESKVHHMRYVCNFIEVNTIDTPSSRPKVRQVPICVGVQASVGYVRSASEKIQVIISSLETGVSVELQLVTISS